MITNKVNSLAIMSLPDGDCALHGMAIAIGAEKTDFVAQIAGMLNSKQNKGAHLHHLRAIGNLVGVPVLTTTDFYRGYAAMDLRALAYSKEFGYDVHMSVIVTDSHAYLVYDPRSFHVRRSIPNMVFSDFRELTDEFSDKLRDTIVTAPISSSCTIKKRVKI